MVNSGQVAGWLEGRKVPLLSPGQGNLVNKHWTEAGKRSSEFKQEAVNTNFSLWCDPTGNRTLVYRFIGWPSTHSNTNWDFRDALRRKSLCFFVKNYEFVNKIKNAITLKRLKVETWNLDLSWSTYRSFLVPILGAIGVVIRVSEPKSEMPIVGLNRSRSKTNSTRRIKLSNLEASGHALSALKNKPWRFRHFFFCLFVYLFKQITLWNKNSKTTTARNLKFGQKISLYMNLRPSNFGGATSRGLGHMHPILVTAKFIKWFYSPSRAWYHGRVVKGASAWNLRPEFNTLVSHRCCQTNIILPLAHQFFFDYDKIVYTIFSLTLDMIRGYQVSFFVKTSQKSASKDLKLVR